MVSLRLPLHSNRIAGSRFIKKESNDNAVFYPAGDKFNFYFDINKITFISSSSKRLLPIELGNSLPTIHEIYVIVFATVSFGGPIPR
ncbi:hypothetical protein [uncultured Desulfosarcina sp.]|uniref:hypothetical protein n=1 Tax=uncultured Desulfosarcina sp. TaxID=218289 RepID=UPI0029C75C41|nr:hypothetical protein [uncultured Desulfosarcina sp.]